jgi:hypothetical protein
VTPDTPEHDAAQRQVAELVFTAARGVEPDADAIASKLGAAGVHPSAFPLLVRTVQRRAAMRLAGGCERLERYRQAKADCDAAQDAMRDAERAYEMAQQALGNAERALEVDPADIAAASGALPEPSRSEIRDEANALREQLVAATDESHHAASAACELYREARDAIRAFAEAASEDTRETERARERRAMAEAARCEAARDQAHASNRDTVSRIAMLSDRIAAEALKVLAT